MISEGLFVLEILVILKVVPCIMDVVALYTMHQAKIHRRVLMQKQGGHNKNNRRNRLR
jgi:hypothetical protein